MRHIVMGVATLLLASQVAVAAELKTDEEKTLYALGAAISRNLTSFSLTPDELKIVEQGLADGVAGGDLKVDLQEFGPKLQAFAADRATKAAAKEKEAGKGFLDKAAAEPGAVKLPSGVIYVETKAGTGASPKPTDPVKVHYHGTLTNGDVFDSSIQRGEPVTFPLNGVIPCWTEGVQKMKVGGKAKLVCPSDTAYGDHGRPPKIKPGATLVFEIELLAIEATPGAGADAAKPEATPPH
ncbi:MAG TPA: FKBP-type peptidyl-prolyl cis-trans isomerase [Thermoanaerobaculia bacterium]|nr:FKBP-type peptidyl-prolyl cis-trans isomerase [Thermoanaerobaculia bacterium]